MPVKRSQNEADQSDVDVPERFIEGMSEGRTARYDDTT